MSLQEFLKQMLYFVKNLSGSNKSTCIKILSTIYYKKVTQFIRFLFRYLTSPSRVYIGEACNNHQITLSITLVKLHNPFYYVANRQRITTTTVFKLLGSRVCYLALSIIIVLVKPVIFVSGTAIPAIEDHHLFAFYNHL